MVEVGKPSWAVSVVSERGFVVVVEAAAVVDPAVGGFGHPASWLDDESVAGCHRDDT